MAMWVEVQNDNMRRVENMEVPGGRLYMVTFKIGSWGTPSPTVVFVPSPSA
jgi:hypothetical protein